ncbi:amino acid/amide ABC transporter substrate-binding protein, HAAT family [Bradyrhizobium sp. Rc3b]|uniref:amino acid ABC transporter substrate-binding protein n=1 Tax=Bradyrhizobium sp. Rc3b TaxID=1855322 RepID=UPI0008EE96CD|nr:amino acid ABC transporter substrate-binding protein [Bradyrhizobium sp. Rc3b]SFM49574.1 amino acid/amide ABC transporter substrate-binding protein, HAAT family [Bradyrhizobium sp. Rc3b]
MNSFIMKVVRSVSAITLTLSVAFVIAPSGAVAQQNSDTIKIGGTLSLTGPLAPTAAMHKIAGEVYVKQLNEGDGLHGRKVEWILLDDQSKPELARTLYERLITKDKVDFISSPYSANIALAVMPVAERYGKALITSTFSMPKLSRYARHFTAWSVGPTPEVSIPTLVLDTLAGAGKIPKTMAIVTGKTPAADFIAAGAREVAKQRGVDVNLYLEYEFGTRDFGPIAARVRQADPDLLFVGALGLEGNMLLEALEKLNYAPRNHFYLYPSPGPLAASKLGANALATALFEDLPPMNQSKAASDFISAYRSAAAQANLPYQEADTQPAAMYSTLQTLTAAVRETKSLDDSKIADWLKVNSVETLIGKLRFDGPGNFGADLTKIKQVQNGKWVVVAPKGFATPGATVIAK